MARARSPNRDKAKELWLKSDKKLLLKDIASELGVLETQVRKWKCQDKWEKNSKGALPKNKSNVPQKKGGQKGNKNAVGNIGGGAPEGNKNNYKHGIYSKVYWDTLTDEEKELIDDMSLEGETNLSDQIRLLTVRERRLLMEIKKYKEIQGNLAIDSVIHRKLKRKGLNEFAKVAEEEEEKITNTISTFDVVMRLEAELTKIQSKKTKCIEALEKLRQERAKAGEDGKHNSLVDDWVKGVIGGEFFE